MSLFLLLVLFASALLVTLSRRWSTKWKILVVGALGAIAFIAFDISDVSVITREPNLNWYARSPQKEIMLFFAMIMGMVSKFLWDAIELRRLKTIQSRRTRLQLDLWDFVQPLLVSGIVFAFVLANTGKISAPALLFSYQNGFFWQTIFRKQSPSAVAP
jgi:hypothetical protein